MLWVDEAWRGQGVGARLLRTAEREGVARGCRQAVLHTHSFQAPEFYQRHGYEIAETLDDYPRGHRKYALWKRLP